MSLYIFDLDGVVYRGEKVLPGVKESLSLLRNRKEQICFLSNNSTLSRQGFLRKLDRLGIQAKLDELYPSSYLAAVYLSGNRQRKENRARGKSLTRSPSRIDTASFRSTPLKARYRHPADIRKATACFRTFIIIPFRAGMSEKT